MIHKRSTALERSVEIFYWEGLNRFHGANLTLSSDVDQTHRCLVCMKDP